MTQPRITTLPNGLRIVTRNMPGLHSATVGVWVNAGGRDEVATQNGIAHFLEHMAFNGTKNFPEKGIIEYFESIGVKFGTNINAYTSLL